MCSSTYKLEKTEQLTAAAFETVSHSAHHSIPATPATVIPKIAGFEWEIPPIVGEARAYQMLEVFGLAPRFLGHIHENGLIIGILVERLQSRSVSIEDLSNCEAALRKLHKLGVLHEDVMLS